MFRYEVTKIRVGVGFFPNFKHDYTANVVGEWLWSAGRGTFFKGGGGGQNLQ